LLRNKKGVIFTGFRTGAYATIWEVDSMSNTRTKGRISTSYKNKDTGAYEQDFGGFVFFTGSACAKKALSLRNKDRIRLGDIEVTNRYDSKSGREYVDFKIFSFDIVESKMSEGRDDRSYNTGKSEREYSGDEENSDDLPF